MRTSHLVWTAALMACLGAASSRACAQEANQPASAPGMVALNFPDDLDLKVLIDYVSKRQGVNFLYDEQIGTMKVTIKGPKEIPASSLMALLESILKMKGLGVSPTGVPGMLRIEVAKPLTVTALGPGAMSGGSPEAHPALGMTRVFALKHASASRVEQVLKPFLSAPTANVIVLAEQDLVVVTDYASNMERLEDLLEVLDRPGRKVSTQFIPIKHMEAAPAALKVSQLLAGKAKVRGEAAGTTGATVLADERTNQIILIGSPGEVEEAAAIIESMDVSLGLDTKVYAFATASAEQVDRLVRELVGELTAKRLYKSAIDHDTNLLIVTAPPEIHAQVEVIRQRLERPVEDSQNPIRFYKLENAKAADVLTTLQSIEGDKGMQGTSVDGVSGESNSMNSSATPIIPPSLVVDKTTDNLADGALGPRRPRGGAGSARGGVVELQNARVMADEASNTIIVVAKPAMQSIYEKLIKRLDVRRPQVLVEVTLVTLDTTDDFELGVEIVTKSSIQDKTKLLTFQSFGLSTVDPSTGAQTLKPGVGFNGALLSADVAAAVIHALESDSRVKVIARPTVLVNDNAKGKLISENEEPYASVNASTTVATTSFAGYSPAGTNILISPQISEGDHLKLEYEITLSSFGLPRQDSLPPARHRNQLVSEATIPNGYTIVVGGLTTENYDSGADRVPLLGRIPALEYLFSNRHKTTKKSTLFVFMRATILRDDKFKDLKVLSRDWAARAKLAGDYPASEPVEIR